MPTPPKPNGRTHASPLLNLDLAELETFVAVAEAGSFSAAAQQLCVTQPAVTGRVRRLETTLGTTLLHRTTRRVETTEHGARLLDEANHALRGLRAVVAGFQEEARLARQRVAVAATPMLAALAMPAVIQRYSQRYPDVQIDLLDMQYRNALEAIDTGVADFALLCLEAEDERYAFEPLRSDDMVLVVPPGHALAQEPRVDATVFVTHSMMIIEQYRALCDRIDAILGSRGLSLAPVRVVGNLTTLVGMLEAGLGITLLPRAIAQRGDAKRHVIVEVDGIDMRRTFGIVQTSGARPGVAAASFCQFLRDTFSA
ncbi:LysR family transcriptional regulator [Paraburkholderia sp. J76]|uniref:LysR family transcriptional regulator n=1 Tax=Paraburkholderia sp. J76 TaxID=2805439 RepID=UPI002ABE7C36|nr:LysR substrate-binding domain-containing protein [Paraburkholderia sp. J76]